MINLNNLEALIAVILAGSLIMERLVTLIKSVASPVFGAPGANPEAIYRGSPALPEEPSHVPWLNKGQARKLYVLVSVFLASGLTAAALSTPTPDGRLVRFGDGETLHWVAFAFLISGGSAFWSQLVGLTSAIKDFRTEQRRHLATPNIVVVDKNDESRLEAGAVE